MNRDSISHKHLEMGATERKKVDLQENEGVSQKYNNKIRGTRTEPWGSPGLISVLKEAF